MMRLARRTICLGIICLVAVLPIQPSMASSPRAKITPENAAQVTALEQLGRGEPTTVQWSPDGRMLAVGSTVGIWLYDTAHLNAEPRYFPEQLDITLYYNTNSGFFFSADSSYLIAQNDGAIYVWDTASGKTILRLPTTPAAYPVLSDPIPITINGKPFDVSFSNQTLRPAVTVEPQTLVTANARHFSEGKLSVSPDERYLLFSPAQQDLPAELWNIQTGKKVADLPVQQAVYTWSPDSQYLDAASSDQTNTFFKTLDGTKVWQNNGTCAIKAWSPDSRTMLWSCADSSGSTSEVVDVQSGKDVASGGPNADDSQVIEFSADGQQIIFYGNQSPDAASGIVVWNFASNNRMTTLPIKADRLIAQSLAVQPNGKLVAFTGSDNRVRIFDLSTQTEQIALRYTPIPTSLVFMPDSQRLISAGISPDNNDSSLFAWDVGSGQMVKDIALSDEIDSLDVSADGQYLLTGSENAGNLWNLQMFTPVTTMRASSPLLFSPWPGTAAFADGQTPFHRWDFGSFSALPHITIPTGLVSRGAAFSNDGLLLFSGDDVYNVNDRAVVAHINSLRGFVSIAVSPDDQFLATSEEYSADVSLWNIRTLSIEAQWRVHSEDTTLQGEGSAINLISVAFSPDGQLLAAGGGHRIVLINVSTKTIVASLDSQSQINNLAFSPDGTLLAGGEEAGIIKIWGVTAQ